MTLHPNEPCTTTARSRIAHASRYTPSLHSCTAKRLGTLAGAAHGNRLLRSAGLRAWTRQGRRRRCRGATPTRRYDWIPVEGDPDPADVAAASEAPCFARQMRRRRRPGSHPSKPRSRSTPSCADDAATAESWLPRPRRARRASLGAPAATGARAIRDGSVCAQPLAVCKAPASWAGKTQHRVVVTRHARARKGVAQRYRR